MALTIMPPSDVKTLRLTELKTPASSPEAAGAEPAFSLASSCPAPQRGRGAGGHPCVNSLSHRREGRGRGGAQRKPWQRPEGLPWEPRGRTASQTLGRIRGPNLGTHEVTDGQVYLLCDTAPSNTSSALQMKDKHPTWESILEGLLSVHQRAKIFIQNHCVNEKKPQCC